jgi:hypothetical protein
MRDALAQGIEQFEQTRQRCSRRCHEHKAVKQEGPLTWLVSLELNCNPSSFRVTFEAYLAMVVGHYLFDQTQP